MTIRHGERSSYFQGWAVPGHNSCLECGRPVSGTNSLERPIFFVYLRADLLVLLASSQSHVTSDSEAYATMSNQVQIIPPGQHPPFAIVTEDDHRAWILVAAALGVSFTLVTILTRILIRLFVNKGWGLDDTLCMGSTVSQPQYRSPG